MLIKQRLLQNLRLHFTHGRASSLSFLVSALKKFTIFSGAIDKVKRSAPECQNNWESITI
jgi:hypothetical protein